MNLSADTRIKKLYSLSRTTYTQTSAAAAAVAGADRDAVSIFLHNTTKSTCPCNNNIERYFNTQYYTVLLLRGTTAFQVDLKLDTLWSLSTFISSLLNPVFFVPIFMTLLIPCSVCFSVRSLLHRFFVSTVFFASTCLLSYI